MIWQGECPTLLKLAGFSLPKCSSAMFERINEVRIRKFNNVLTDAVGMNQLSNHDKRT